MQTSTRPCLRPVATGRPSVLERRVHRVLRRGGLAPSAATSEVAAEPTATYATTPTACDVAAIIDDGDPGPDGTRTWRHRTGLTSTVRRPRRRLDDPT